MPQVKSEYLLSLLIVALGVAAYLPKLTAVVAIDHDDVISIISATCNEAGYNESVPGGRWVAAGDWQQYWQLHGFGCFGQISHDLVHYDIHPPLYFWLLHIWLKLFGVSVLSGLTLSLVVLLITTVVMFACCRLLSVSNVLSFITALAWMVSLPSRTTVGVIRQYALLSLLTALLMLVVILWLKTGRTRYVFAISAVLVAGFLTHYQFPIPAAFTLLFAAAVGLKNRRYKDIAKLIAAGAVAAVIFYVVNPGFREAIWRAHEQAQPFDLATFPQRLVAMAGTILQLFNPLDWSHPLPYGLLDWTHPLYVVINVLNLVAGGGAVYLIGRMVVKTFRTRPRPINAMLSVEFLPAFAAVTSWSTIAAMYVFFVSPVHAVGLQYLHFVTPFLFVSVGQAAEAYREDIPDRVILALPPVLVVSAIFATALFAIHRPEQQRILDVKAAGALIVDTDRIGILPTVLWHADPGTPVFAAPQDALLAAFPDPRRVTDRRFDYVSSLAYGNTTHKRDAILDRLSKLGRGAGVPQSASVVYLIPLGGDVYRFGN